jgi:hypothetical protein
MLPGLLLLIFGYVALPWWLPLAVGQIVRPYGIDILQLDVRHPDLARFHIDRLRWQSHNSQLAYTVDVQNIDLDYTLQSLWLRQQPNRIRIEQLLIQAEQKSKLTSFLNEAPIFMTAFIPSKWLGRWPELIEINRIEGQLLQTSAELPGYSRLQYTGKLSKESTQLNVVCRLTSNQDNLIFAELNFALDDQVTIKLYNHQKAAPVAKLTSSIRFGSNTLLWQGQSALNLPVMQDLLGPWLGEDWRINMPLKQGRLINHWQLSMPVTPPKNWTDFLDLADGENQVQLQLIAQPEHPLVQTADIDVNVTQTLVRGHNPTIRLNTGSRMQLVPDWRASAVPQNLQETLQLDTAQLELMVSSDLDLQIQTSIDRNDSPVYVFHGTVDATLENTQPVYKAFARFSDIQVTSGANWRGKTELSGYLDLQQSSSMHNLLPFNGERLQWLVNAQIQLNPALWSLTVEPNARIYASSVESRQDNGQTRLFAADKLKLSNSSPIQLNYQLGNGSWQWQQLEFDFLTGQDHANNDVIIASEGMHLVVNPGSSQYVNRPVTGSFDLLNSRIRIDGIPDLHLLGHGQFNLLAWRLNSHFKLESLPLLPTWSGIFDWNLANGERRLGVSIPKQNITSLLSELPQLQLSMDIHEDQFNYTGEIRW